MLSFSYALVKEKREPFLRSGCWVTFYGRHGLRSGHTGFTCRLSHDEHEANLDLDSERFNGLLHYVVYDWETSGHGAERATSLAPLGFGWVRILVPPGGSVVGDVTEWCGHRWGVIKLTNVQLAASLSRRVGGGEGNEVRELIKRHLRANRKWWRKQEQNLLMIRDPWVDSSIRFTCGTLPGWAFLLPTIHAPFDPETAVDSLEHMRQLALVRLRLTHQEDDDQSRIRVLAEMLALPALSVVYRHLHPHRQEDHYLHHRSRREPQRPLE